MTILACHNFWNARPPAVQDAHVDVVANRVAMLAACELVTDVNAPNRREWQPRRRGGGPGSEALVTALPILRKGGPEASTRKFGQAIGWRRMPWVLTRFPEVPRPVMVIVFHGPPRRMRSAALRAAYAATVAVLVARARRNGWEWIVAGDFNRRESENPAGLLTRRGRRLGRRWYGSGIDGFIVSPGLVPHVARCWAVLDPARRDGHPEVYLALRGIGGVNARP